MTDEVHEKEAKDLELYLPKVPLMGSNLLHLVKYQNLWYPDYLLNNILTFQKHFQPRDTDIILASFPKAGTTWLKTLLFAVVNRVNHPTNQSPILTSHPHDLVYSLENGIYKDQALNYPCVTDLHDLPSPRLLSSHLSYTFIPESIKTSKCRIIYISRNPLDSFVSQWYFYTKLVKKKSGDDHDVLPSYSLNDFFEDFIEGRIMYGPFFEHIIEYWKQSLERPDKVLFFKYEDLKDDPTLHLKRLADFVGMPFSREEESGGVIRDIIKLCSIDTLKELDVNKNGLNYTGLETKDFFRKGEVGDWTNYLTPPMVERVSQLMQQRLEGTGLTFKLFP